MEEEEEFLNPTPTNTPLCEWSDHTCGEIWREKDCELGVVSLLLFLVLCLKRIKELPSQALTDSTCIATSCWRSKNVTDLMMWNGIPLCQPSSQICSKCAIASQALTCPCNSISDPLSMQIVRDSAACEHLNPKCFHHTWHTYLESAFQLLHFLCHFRDWVRMKECRLQSRDQIWQSRNQWLLNNNWTLTKTLLTQAWTCWFRV